MKKILLSTAALALGFLTACEQGANTINRPANATANNAAATAPAANAASIETDIKKLANDMSAAQLKGDAAVMDKLWADNYMFVGPDGSVATKAQRLEAMKSGDSKFESLAYDEMSVRSNPEGTGAVLIGRVTGKGTNLGTPVSGQYRMTQVWSKTKNGWQLVSGQVTSIAGGGSSGTAANTSSTSNTAANTSANKPANVPANK